MLTVPHGWPRHFVGNRKVSILWPDLPVTTCGTQDDTVPVTQLRGQSILQYFERCDFAITRSATHPVYESWCTSRLHRNANPVDECNHEPTSTGTENCASLCDGRVPFISYAFSSPPSSISRPSAYSLLVTGDLHYLFPTFFKLTTSSFHTRFSASEAANNGGEP
jgi:hypothetical protein